MEIEVDELSVGMGGCPLGDDNKCIDYGSVCQRFIEIANGQVSCDFDEEEKDD